VPRGRRLGRFDAFPGTRLPVASRHESDPVSRVRSRGRPRISTTGSPPRSAASASVTTSRTASAVIHPTDRHHRRPSNSAALFTNRWIDASDPIGLHDLLALLCTRPGTTTASPIHAAPTTRQSENSASGSKKRARATRPSQARGRLGAQRRVLRLSGRRSRMYGACRCCAGPRAPRAREGHGGRSGSLASIQRFVKSAAEFEAAMMSIHVGWITAEAVRDVVTEADAADRGGEPVVEFWDVHGSGRENRIAFMTRSDW